MSSEQVIRKSGNTNTSMTEYIKQREGRAVAIFYNSAELSDPDGKQINRPRRFATSSARTFLQFGRTTQISLTAQTELAATNPQFVITRNPQLYRTSQESSSGGSPAPAPAPAPVNIQLVNGTASDVFVVKYSSSGNPVWARRMTSPGSSDIGKSIVTDSDGNIYVAGQYNGDLIIYDEDNETTFATLIQFDIYIHGFIVKYNSDGVPQWARRITGTGTSTSCNGIKIDSNKNVYVTGIFQGSVTFYNSNNSTSFKTISRNSTEVEIFLAKYNTNGIPQWATHALQLDPNRAFAIAVDSNGNSYITGQYQNTLTFYNENGTTFATTLTTPGSIEVFVAKYNTSGFVVWVARLVSGGDDIGNGIATDSNGNVFVTGSYQGTLTMYNQDNTTQFTTLTQVLNNDIFIVKYDTDGVPKWARRITSSGNDIGYAITTDSTGNIYATGRYGLTATIYTQNNSTTFATLNSAGNTDVYIVKYDTDGIPLWARRIGSTSSDTGFGISTDSSSNVYVTGGYTGNLIIYDTNNSSTFTTLDLISGNDAFLVKYNSDGTPQWARRIAGSSSLDISYSVTTDSSGNAIITGEFNSNPLTAFIGQ